jgi:chemotaxis protein methyltransferase CheR
MPALSPALFAILSAIVEERTGIHYNLADNDLLGEKVSARAAVAGFESILDYYYFLRYDEGSAAELDALIDALVVGETYFFRELDQLECAARTFLAPLVAAGARPRVWSAACATGEEPLSLAMVLAANNLEGRVDIVASDISPRALARARAGDFGRRAIRSGCIPPAYERWLRLEDGVPKVAQHLVDSIVWKRINLVDRAAVDSLGTFDVIFCRNVLIYFRDDVVKLVVGALAGRLRERGALFVGVSESLLRHGTSLVCEEHGGVFLYRRAGEP